MGMGDIPNKDLAFEQQKSTQTLRRVTCDGRQHQEPTPLPHKRSKYVVTPDPEGTATVEVVLLPRMTESISMQSRGSLCTGYPDPGGNSSVEVAELGPPVKVKETVFTQSRGLPCTGTPDPGGTSTDRAMPSLDALMMTLSLVRQHKHDAARNKMGCSPTQGHWRRPLHSSSLTCDSGQGAHPG